MDTLLLKKKDVQNKMKKFLGEIRIKKGRSIVDIATSTQLSYQTVTKFLYRDGSIGMETLIKLATYIIKNGYSLDDE